MKLQGAQENHEAEVIQKSHDDVAVAQKKFEVKLLEEKCGSKGVPWWHKAPLRREA